MPNSLPPYEAGNALARASFLECLEALRGASLHIDWLAGNNGDRLIRMGLARLLEQASAAIVESPQEADVIVLSGGGAMNEFWGGGLAVLESYRRRFPAKPLHVAPSSFHVSRERFLQICDLGDAPLVLYCREERSYDWLRRLQPPEHVDVRLAQDLALELQGGDFIREQLPKRSRDHFLIAMRGDREGNAGIYEKARAPWLPPLIRRPLSRVRTRLIARRSRRVIDAIGRAMGVPHDVPRVYCDVSVGAEFDEFVRLIRTAHTIVTDRLHCGILAYMLNKHAVLRPGSYHKVQGVFEYSLSGPGSRVTMWAD